MKTVLTAWDKVQISRNVQRPRTLDYVRVLCDEYFEFHGDRRFADDAAIVAGVGRMLGRSVVIVGHQKGRDTRDNMKRNFGMPKPDGYRKAMRLFAHAEKFSLPVVCLIDTPGADPSMESETRGQGNAIAENILQMAQLRTPIVSCVIGEGGSGGALAIGVTDRIYMLEHSVYSVAAPEASAAILWRDSSKAADAARTMRITAQDLTEMGIVDGIIPEPEGGAHLDADNTVRKVGEVIMAAIDELMLIPIDQLLTQRYDKYRVIGAYDTLSTPQHGHGEPLAF
ncbi:MAG: acetyl-CoA carboxylase carboxyltransferase subunit alpha [Roseiflexaceae bacterium]|jgi:acetyl-CoA carboxylase carboxyl transferase subunit alpha|nr:acetyl-CoA carboxylase carboxyltransferase subunit alpha [Chloroflexaceae bacterium]MCE2853439.1 acetyl-CoA carboxylase carboxyltransferase subunit alpha [Chloroflexaceae bacterium]